MLDKQSKAASAGKPAVGYVRRSTDLQTQSLDDQRRAIEVFAERSGFEICGWFQDDAVSGVTTSARSGLQRMLAEAQSPNRAWQYVLVFDVSRLSRGDMDESGHLRYQFRQAGVQVVYCVENFTGSDSDDLVLGVKQWQARQYVKDLSRVTIRGLISSVESGSYHGGTPPHGYDYLYLDSANNPIQSVRWDDRGRKEIYSPRGDLIRIVPQGERLTGSKQDRIRLIPSIPARVAVIRRIFEEYVQGLGYRAISQRLNSEGVPSSRSGDWSPQYTGTWGITAVRNIIINRVYVGDTVWNRRTFGKFHRITRHGAVERPRHQAGAGAPNPQSEWIIIPKTHEALVPRSLFEAAEANRQQRNHEGYHTRQPKGRGFYSNYLLSGLIECGDCGHKFSGWSTKGRRFKKHPDAPRNYFYLCGAYLRKGSAVCPRVAYAQRPLEDFILSRLQARLLVFLQEGGDQILRRYIAEEFARVGSSPADDLARIHVEMSALKKDADRLLDNLTPANRDFVDDRLVATRRRLRELEAREQEIQGVVDHPLDVEAATTQALGRLSKIREVLAHGSIVERKAFVGGLIEGITLNPSKHRGVVRFYDLSASLGFRSGSRPKLYRRMRAYGLPIDFGRARLPRASQPVDGH